MLSNTYAIRAGAQQFASVAEGMRQKANSIEQNTMTLREKWRGKASDAYHSVSELLGNDIQTASHAFEQAANALHVLAERLDQVNSLRQQADQLSSQIQSLEWSLSAADDHNRASISSEISQLSYRISNLHYEADSMEYQANAAASGAFDDIAGMVNRLHFYHGTQVASSDSSVLDKVGHFFSGLWHKTENAIEDAYQEVSHEFQKVESEIKQSLDEFQSKVEQGGWLGGTVGFVEGLASSVIDTVEFAVKMNPMNMIQDAILHPEATYEKAKAIFNDLEHPVQTAENLWDGAKVLWSTVKQSFDQDIIHGNAYTRSEWAGYAVGVIAQTLATDGGAAAAKGATIAAKGATIAAKGTTVAAKGAVAATKGVVAATKGATLAGEGVEVAAEGAKTLSKLDSLSASIKSSNFEEISKTIDGTSLGAAKNEDIHRLLKEIDSSELPVEQKVNASVKIFNKAIDEGVVTDVQVYKDSSVLDETGRVKWPKEDGFVLDNAGKAIKEAISPKVGQTFDRFGPESGRFVSPLNNDTAVEYSNRALPYIENPNAYNQYMVKEDFSRLANAVENIEDPIVKRKVYSYMERYQLKPENLKVFEGEIAPAFHSPGGGIQWQLPLPVELLQDLEFVEKIH